MSYALKQKSKFALCFGPCDYLKVKTEEKFIKEYQGSCMRLPAEKVGSKELDEMFFQDSIFDPSLLYIIKNVEKKGDFSKNLAILKASTAIRNTILLHSNYKTVPKALQKEMDRLGGTMIPCYGPNAYELKRFIVALAKRFQLNLSDSASEFLSSSIGNDFFSLENEIRKLSLIFSEAQGATITADQIAPYTDYLKEENAFKLDQFIMQKELGHAQALLHDLLKRGQSPLALLGILSHHCRKSLQIHSLLMRHQGVNDIIKVVRMPMFILRSYVDYVKKSSHQKFKTALLECNEADIMLKTSKIDHDLVLSRILLTLTA